MGDFDLWIGVFIIKDWGFPEFRKHQFQIQDLQLIIFSPIGNFHF